MSVPVVDTPCGGSVDEHARPRLIHKCNVHVFKNIATNFAIRFKARRRKRFSFGKLFNLGIIYQS